MKLSKKALTLCIAASMLIGMTGCGDKEEISYQAIKLEDLINNPGTFILSSKDGMAHPTITNGQTETLDHWFLTEDQLQNVYELGPKDQLIFTDITKRPSTFVFHKFDELGYTVGCNFDVITETTDEKSPVIITFGTHYNPFSPIGDYLTAYVAEVGSNVKITDINGIKMKTSMLTSSGYLKGLTKDAMYKFSYYRGTHFNTITIKADSLLLYETEKYSSNSYAEMDSTYFVVNIPDEMPNGYYYLEGYGLFKYSGKSTDINDNDKEILTDEQEQTTESINDSIDGAQ